MVLTVALKADTKPQIYRRMLSVERMREFPILLLGWPQGDSTAQLCVQVTSGPAGSPDAWGHALSMGLIRPTRQQKLVLREG